eukprot:TRINITY_DN8089_c0_g2_i1.p1 TRINITY_DN8089_c0_g2~~TRINITY_DN8089_c0_g2_i1.p1  ORF type:complete len:184 (-),score=25.06 TRINITY_DN8089_c0_g2_i1:25-501(-)
MGCAASVRTAPPVPFTQVMPFDESEVDTKAQVSLQQDKDNGECSRETRRTESADVESEPSKAVSFQSFFFEPSPKNWAFERIPPCAPTHRRHLRRLDKALMSWRVAPQELREDIDERRKRFDDSTGKRSSKTGRRHGRGQKSAPKDPRSHRGAAGAFQ